MLAVFDAGNRKSVCMTAVFVESVLKACIADGVDGTEFKVFDDYLYSVRYRQIRSLIDAMLVEYVNFAYDNKIKILPEEFYELIGKKIDHRKDGLDVSAALS